MASTTNYNWTTPDNSGLVKNGAQDIRTLGSAVDTSLWNVGFGQAGKNKIINGDMSVWQRGTSISLTSGVNSYAADRFIASCTFSAGSATVSRQTFTPASAPVAGYEGQYFSRLTCGSTTTVWAYRQRIENVQSFAGQTVTLSFWIKASAANATTAIQFAQNFGSGGSTTVTVDLTGPSITTSWQRFSVTTAIPSISGKTIGTSSYLETTIYSTTGIASSLAVDLWGVQVEYGSVATAFQTATGTIAGELAACQRYFWNFSAASNNVTHFCNASNNTTTQAIGVIRMPVTMRVSPSVTLSAANTFRVNQGGVGDVTCSTVAGDQMNPDSANILFNVSSGLTVGSATRVLANASTSASLQFSSEL